LTRLAISLRRWVAPLEQDNDDVLGHVPGDGFGMMKQWATLLLCRLLVVPTKDHPMGLRR
jgi:hypothetical protein